MSVPFAPARCSGTQRYGLATRVGRSFTCHALRSGRRMKGRQQHNSKAYRTAIYHHRDNGVVQAAICQRTQHQRRTHAGAKRRSIHGPHQDCRRILVVTHAAKSAYESALILANSHVMLDLVLLVHTWDRLNHVSVASTRPPGSVSTPTMPPGGAAMRSAGT